ncbi:MAG: hypothetical protein NTX12_01035 [Actinobacteria bacterium]|nr:hypothetical protein [Actinomycetota bacterium]
MAHNLCSASSFSELREFTSDVELIESYLEEGAELPTDIFDLAICVEVIEHIDKAHMHFVLDYLTSHSRFLLFSGATVGQGGTHHVNERSMEFWHQELSKRGMVQLDVIRPILAKDLRVPSYYRHNIFLYFSAEKVNQDKLEINWPDLLKTGTFHGLDIRPTGARIIQFATRWLPTWLVTRIAQLKGR